MYVAADQQLVRRAAPALKTDLGIGALGGGEERGRRIGAAPRVAQRLGAVDLELSAHVLVQLAEPQRDLPQGGRELERERVLGPARGLDRELAGMTDRARCLEVAHRGEGILIGDVRGEQYAREPLVVAPAACRRDARDDRLANAVVVRLDRIVDARPAGANQRGRAQRTERLGQRRRLELERQADDALRQRRTGHRDELEHAARTRLHAQDPRPQRVVEPGRRGSRRAGVTHELVDEHRMTGCVVDERRRLGLAVGGEQRDQLAAFLGRQPPELDRVHRARELGAGSRLAAPGHDHEDSRSVGWMQDLPQQRDRIGIGPLDVVDHDDDRLMRGERAEQGAQPAERARPELDRRRGPRHAHPRDRGHAAQHREHAGERLDLVGEQQRDIDRVAAEQLARQRVDDAVDPLERHALALVAAAGEHERPRALRLDTLDEIAHERALADPALALDEHRGAATGDDLVERAVERGELARASDERQWTLLGGRARGQARDDHGRGRPGRRRAAQQIHAQARQLGRRCDAERRRRILLLLADQDLERGAVEWQPARERLVQHHADGVRIGRSIDRGRAGLLGGHVRGGPDDILTGAAVRRAGIADEPEVEDHDAALARDQHVRRLEIAMDLAAPMDRVEPRGELTHGIAQAGVGPARRITGTHPVEERPALDELHGEEPVAAVVEKLAKAYEVAVLDVDPGAKLGLEPVQRLRVELAQGLERDDHRALAIVGLVDHAHATLTEHPAQLESVAPGEVLLGRRRGRHQTVRRRHRASV